MIIAELPLCALSYFSYQGHFIVWEGAPGARMAWKGHKRHVFLFKNYIVICKPKRDTKTDTYSYIFKNIMKVWSLHPYLQHFSVIENFTFMSSFRSSKNRIFLKFSWALPLLLKVFEAEVKCVCPKSLSVNPVRNMLKTTRSMGGFLLYVNEIYTYKCLQFFVISLS